MGRRTGNRQVLTALSCLALALAGLLTLLPGGRVLAEEAINVPGPLSPREVTLPAPEGSAPADFTLRDADGSVIPLTGSGVVISDGYARITPPKLAEGVYHLEHPGGREMLTVGEPSAAGSPTSSLPLWVFAAPFLVLGLILLTRGGKLLGGGAIALALAIPAVGLISGDRARIDAPDPCGAITESQALRRCMLDHVTDVVETSGIAAAVQRLEHLSARSGSGWSKECHDVAHYLGQASLRTDFDAERLVEVGTISCSFGYFHGLLEVLGTYSSDDDFPARALELCLELGERFAVVAADGSDRECAHGIGHAAMWRYNEDLERARPVCAALPEDTWVEECDSGVVMSWVFARESSRSAGRPEDAPSPLVEKPLDLCTPPYAQPTSGCIDGALSGTLRAEYDDTLAWCVARPEFGDICTNGLARRLTAWQIEDAGFDMVGETGRLCSALYTERAGVDECVANVSWAHLYFLRDYPRTEQFCRELGDALTRACRDGVLRFYETLLRRGDRSGGEIPPDVLAELENGR
jgi:hypothetical protein